MKLNNNLKLNLTEIEKSKLRKHKVKIREVPALSVNEIERLLEVITQRAREIFALAEFQSIPSIGIKFAEDLIYLSYFSLNELKEKNGPRLIEEFEVKKGYWVDPCVEDQFRLVVDFTRNRNTSNMWWNYTADRKKYREENGYPSNRPNAPWHELI